jgi:hypothetical protein
MQADEKQDEFRFVVNGQVTIVENDGAHRRQVFTVGWSRTWARPGTLASALQWRFLASFSWVSRTSMSAAEP